MIYKKQIKSQIKGVQVEEGESLMKKLRKMFEKGEAPEEALPLIYTNKSEGVRPGDDIRTDRYEILREAADKLKSSEKQERAEARAAKTKAPEKEESAIEAGVNRE